MNNNGLVLLTFSLFLSLVYAWGFRTLPKEGWQVMACIPREKKVNGSWQGLNLTYYGFFNAFAYTAAVLLLIVLLMSLPATPLYIYTLASCGLLICVPASRFVAYLVEGKRHTFTVGGASFVGIIMLPWAAWMINKLFGGVLGGSIPVMTAMAAVSTAYCLGEGIGRLACISFGCCYGKPLSDVHPFLKRVFSGSNFIFSGSTKKIAYAHGFDGRPVIPVQALTSIVFTGSALAGSYLFLKGHHTSAFLVTLIITQMWRLLSEFLRADYRGDNSFSAYQIMACISVCYSIFLSFLFPVPDLPEADIIAGLSALWNPSVIISLQALWIAIYIFTGRSQVTASEISMHVIREKI